MCPLCSSRGKVQVPMRQAPCQPLGLTEASLWSEPWVGQGGPRPVRAGGRVCCRVLLRALAGEMNSAEEESVPAGAVPELRVHELRVATGRIFVEGPHRSDRSRARKRGLGKRA